MEKLLFNLSFEKIMFNHFLQNNGTKTEKYFWLSNDYKELRYTGN